MRSKNFFANHDKFYNFHNFFFIFFLKKKLIGFLVNAIIFLKYKVG
jgi:hypothetical protein